MSEPDLAAIVAAVAHSKRYRHVAPGLVRRLAAEELPKAKNAADAEKRTKRRLHQIFGAYATPLPYEKLTARLSAAAKAGADAFKEATREVLKLHASTAERLPELETFYEPIFKITGKPFKVLDLACGLNPLSVLWMNLSPNAFYVGVDIDAELANFVDRFLAMAPGVHGVGRVNDLVAGPPRAWADVAFLLKTLPVLQHQTGDVLPILDTIKAPWLVVSFPTKSLGNRSKGMAATYRATMQELMKSRPAWQSHEISYPSELVYVIKKN
jgi:16S rRNA (guanine(1405)-N(7))-methyltransferase